MRTPPLKYLSILPPLLHCLCLLTSSLSPLGPSMRVCFMFRFFTMLRQRKMVPASGSSFDPSRHSCRGDIFMAPPSLLVLVRWTQTLQSVSTTPVLPTLVVPDHRTYPVVISSPHSPPLHLINHSSPSLKHNRCVTVTITMLSRALSVMLDALGLDSGLFSLPSLQRRAATAVYSRA